MSAVPLTYTKESGRKDKPLDTLLGTQCCMCSCLRYLKKCKPFGKVSPGIITINPFPPLPCSTLSSTPPPPRPTFSFHLQHFIPFLGCSDSIVSLAVREKRLARLPDFLSRMHVSWACIQTNPPIIVYKRPLPNQSPTLHLIPFEACQSTIARLSQTMPNTTGESMQCTNLP